MAYLADYKVVDGMIFVRLTTPKGSVVSYGKKSSVALANLMNKYALQFNERVRVVLGEMTDAPLETMVTVRHTRQSEWWFRHRSAKGISGFKQTAQAHDDEYIYEVEGNLLKVYKVTLEKEYKIKEQKTPKPFMRPMNVMEGDMPTKLPAEPGMVLFNANEGE